MMNYILANAVDMVGYAILGGRPGVPSLGVYPTPQGG